MRKCANCQTAITCSCQVRVASDQKGVCATCIAAYERMLINAKSEPATLPS